MRNPKTLAIVVCAIVLGVVVLALNVSADTWNKKTVLTTSQPLKIPGVTLPPGNYVFKLLDSQSNRHIVQVFNEDETKVYATLLAIPNYRLQPTDDTKFSFWEMPQGSPPALRSWFYPGDNFGQEFAYPKSEATQIASQVKEEVLTITEEDQAKLAAMPVKAEETASASNQPESQPATAESPTTSEPSSEAATSSADTASQSTASDTGAKSTEEATSLPKTASPYPAIGMIGLLSLGLALGFRILRQQIS